MTIPGHRLIFERLMKGVGNKDILENGAFHPKNILQNLTWDFSNESIKVVIPSNCTDVDRCDSLDPNDKTRTRIHHNYELLYCVIYYN